jgi:hypothetical protein
MKMVALIFSLSFGLFVATANGSDLSSLQPIWKQGIEAYQKAQYPEAAARFERWIKEADSRGISSAQAHINLGLSDWAMESKGPAVFHLLKGSCLRNFPWRFTSDLRTLSGIQGELGVRDGVPDQWSFKVYLFLTRNVQILSVVFAFWMFILATVLFFFHFRRVPTWAPVAFCAGGMLSAFVGLAGYLNHNYQGPLAVLNHPKEGVALFRIPRDSNEEKLVDLPSGTIVRLGPKQGDGFSQITDPLAGWIKTDEFLALDH